MFILRCRPVGTTTTAAILVVLATVVAVLVPPGTAAASPSEEERAIGHFVWDDINHQRLIRGLDRLRRDPEVDRSSQRLAAANAADGTLAHSPERGLTPARPAGSEGMREVVGAATSSSSPGAFTGLWLDSDGHREAMLDPDARIGGVGYARDGSYRTAAAQFHTGQFSPPRFGDAGTHATAIHRLAAAGVTGGCAADRYCPNDPLTRAQLATFLARVSHVRPAVPQRFSDVPFRGPHAHNIEAIARAGITAGCGGDRFCPRRTVTRGQAASFIARAAQLPAGDGLRFVDVPAHHAHHDGIAAVAAAEVTSGCSRDRFCPDDPVTRGQLATLFDRAGLR